MFKYFISLSSKKKTVLLNFKSIFFFTLKEDKIQSLDERAFSPDYGKVLFSANHSFHKWKEH